MTDINDKLHPKLKEILAVPENPDATAVEEQTPDEARAEWKGDMSAVDGPAPEMAETRDIVLAGPAGDLSARLYVPAGLAAENRPCLVYFHGGGFIRGDIDTHDSVCRVLAEAANVAVISVDYRLAPEARCPAPVEDAHAAVAQIVARAAEFGVDPARIAVGGDSAGGNISAALTLMARDGSGPAIKAQLLIYPVTDLLNETDSARLFSRGYLLNSMPFYTASYLGPDGNAADPLASPLLAEDHAGLPSAIVITAGYDPLRDEGVAYAEKLREAGGEVVHLHYDNMIHGFSSLRGLLDEADASLREAGSALARLL
ncbi:alpha/beta hydrolase [Microbaculum marinisediminis]|uniref:Alpha/beta hydrolase n=1 Tax=Microbaculum marinisediminis TaxID=2931392 RepID=A0AAW5QYA4_9HYPH|nr:alpha/beta hydrolase [Microbaculum sp. A6E488]MCT8971401.1 alpha/beta hydrolase [Microbaculum sp. A6E488]